MFLTKFIYFISFLLIFFSTNYLLIEASLTKKIHLARLIRHILVQILNLLQKELEVKNLILQTIPILMKPLKARLGIVSPYI